MLGDGTTTTQLLPVVVKNSADTATLTGITRIAAGGLGTSQRMNNATVRCSSSNANGKLGDGTTTEPAGARDGSDPVAGIGLRSASSRTESMQAREVAEDALPPLRTAAAPSASPAAPRVAIEGTLVSADLSGFTALSEKLAALGVKDEELTTLLTNHSPA